MSIRYYAGQGMYYHECPQCGDSWWDHDSRDQKCLFCARWAAYAAFMNGAEARKRAGRGRRSAAPIAAGYYAPS